MNEKVPHDRQKCKLLEGTLRSPKKITGHRQLYLNCGNFGHWVIDCLMLCLSPESCPNWGHFVLIALHCLPKVPFHKNTSETFWIWLQKANAVCPVWQPNINNFCPYQNHWEHSTQSNRWGSSESLSFLSIHRPFGLYFWLQFILFRSKMMLKAD